MTSAISVISSKTTKQRRRREAIPWAPLTKLNQIGIVTETIQAIALCRKAGWNYVVFHCSGET